MAFEGVVGVGIGQRRWRHHFEPDLALVVMVAEKLPPEELAAKDRRPVPRVLKVKVGRRAYEIPVDVQHSWGERMVRPHGLVGTAVRGEGSVVGGVGGVVVAYGDEQAPYLLVAAHVAEAVGKHLTFAGGLTGVVRRLDSLYATGERDHALVEPSRPVSPAERALLNGRALNGVRSVDLELVGESVYCHDCRTGERRATTVRSIHETAWVALPGPVDPTRASNLIGVDACTSPGDSGTVLYDAELRAIGTLLGSMGAKSYFLPCDEAFIAMDLELLT